MTRCPTYLLNMADRGCRKLVRCGHCEQEVSKRTFYQHKRLYFDSKSKTWSREARVYHDTASSSADVFQLPINVSELEGDEENLLNDGEK